MKILGANLTQINLYMTREALALQNRKKKLWKTYLKTQDTLDYCRFYRARTQSPHKTPPQKFRAPAGEKLTREPKGFLKILTDKVGKRVM